MDCTIFKKLHIFFAVVTKYSNLSFTQKTIPLGIEVPFNISFEFSRKLLYNFTRRTEKTEVMLCAHLMDDYFFLSVNTFYLLQH